VNISKFVHFESTELIVSSLGCVFKVLSVGISFPKLVICICAVRALKYQTEPINQRRMKILHKSNVKCPVFSCLTFDIPSVLALDFVTKLLTYGYHKTEQQTFRYVNHQKAEMLSSCVL